MVQALVGKGAPENLLDIGRNLRLVDWCVRVAEDIEAIEINLDELVGSFQEQ